jgi:uncharacterized hydantoinase/oxoprolinase family protein
VVAANVKEFLAVCDEVNLIVDNREPEIVEVGEVLGLEVDLANKRFRLSKSWAEKANALKVNSFMSARDVYTITGNAIWHDYVKNIPLCRRSRVIELIRRIAKMICTEEMQWDAIIHLSTREVVDL